MGRRLWGVEDSGGLEDQSSQLWDGRVNDETKSIEEVQRGFCRERDIEYVPAPGDLKLGFALATLGQLPINGLRHRPSDGTSGWYIWCSESFSGADDFFDALQTWISGSTRNCSRVERSWFPK